MVERRTILSKQGYIRDVLSRIKQRREKVCLTMKKAVPELKKEISEKKEILVAPEDLGKKLGLGLLDSRRHPTSIYWDAKYCLWKEGISVTSRKTDSRTRIIRAIRPEDELHKELK